MKLKVSNLKGKNGNPAQNQFIIETPKGIFFQSYRAIVVQKTSKTTILDRYYWNYSRTTGKYRNLFLGETKKETEAKIKAGIYQLKNLN